MTSKIFDWCSNAHSAFPHMGLGRLIAAASVALLAGVAGAQTENFDTTAVGALPGTWSSTSTGAGAAWVVTDTQSRSAPNSAFTNDIATVSSQFLVLPTVNALGPVLIDLWYRYTTENTYDGWVIESNINGAGWTNIGQAAWTVGGYTATISANFQSAILSQRAFSGNVTAWTHGAATLNTNNGDVVELRIHMASDTSVASTGVWIDDVTVTTASNFGACCDASGGCTQNTSAACTTGGGFFFGIGNACSATTCPVGACCNTGACTLKISNACVGAGNTFFAGGSCTAAFNAPTPSTATIEDISITGSTPGTAYVAGGNGGVASLDDGNMIGVDIGFTFNFYGQPQTTATIVTNGYLYFGAGSFTAYTPAAMPTAATPNGLVAPLWVDMILASADQISYATAGVAPYRRFIVQWNNVGRYNAGAPTGSNTFQIILYETADAIAFRYGSMDAGVAVAVPGVGVESPDGTLGTPVDPNLVLPGNTALFWAAGFNPCSGSLPTGSCCSNGCQQLSYPACLAAGGAFNGNGTTCATAPCTSGACCALAGGCTLQVGPICTGANGVYQGNGTTCGATPCPATGSCCNGTVCSSGFQANCSGTFTASGSCTPNNCGGSCCDANGVCTLATSTGTCAGTFAGAGTTCTANPCPAPPNDDCAGAIALIVGDPPVTGTTRNSTQSYNPLPGWCAASELDVFWSFTVPAAGNYGISMTNTVGTSVIVMANCGDTVAIACSGTVANNAIALFTLPAAGTYFIRNASFTGANAGGTFSIEVHTVTAGACCNDTTGACVAVTTGVCAAGATYQGDNTACSATQCGQGACCNAATGVCTLATATGCTGQFQSVATTCTPTNPCPQPPTGACCNSTTGACTQVFAANCSVTTSTYSGDNTTCDASGFCPGIGTCCSSLGNCFVRYVADCPAGVTNNAALTCSAGLCPIVGPHTCENFDAGTVGALPANWSSTSSAAGAPWVIDSAQSNSPSNAVFTNDVASVSSQILQLPAVTAGGTLTLDFLSYFDTETNWDGWVVEYSTDSGGTWTDIAVGGTWVLNGYNNAALNVSTNPLTGRPAFSGVFTAWTSHIATIPANNGDSVIVRFQMASDGSVAHVGVWLDDICIGGIQGAAGTGVCCRGATCTTTFASAGACTAGLNGNLLAGASFSNGAACNGPTSTNTPCCYGDYNKLNSIEVQDIFDFINDWLASSKFAIVGGNGTTGTLDVQNIFDFLNAWFAGGCN